MHDETCSTDFFFSRELLPCEINFHQYKFANFIVLFGLRSNVIKINNKKMGIQTHFLWINVIKRTVTYVLVTTTIKHQGVRVTKQYSRKRNFFNLIERSNVFVSMYISHKMFILWKQMKITMSFCWCYFQKLVISVKW